MPTARELLEQADALMRRNRGGEAVPMLTDSVREALGEPAQDLRAADAAHAPPPGEDLDLALDRSVEQSVEPPLLTDVVEEVAVDVLPLPGGKPEEDAAPWLGPDTIDPALHSITGSSPDSLAVVPAVLRAERAQVEERVAEAVGAQPSEVLAPEVRVEARAEETIESAEPAAHAARSYVEEELPEAVEAPDPTATRTLRAQGSASTPAPAGSLSAEAIPLAEIPDEDRWQALAEQISMQVLQRLDLFVDTGLKTRLAAHLQPIVERAGAELVEAINEHVGQLVRSYVAEAIEREIAQWRQDQR